MAVGAEVLEATRAFFTKVHDPFLPGEVPLNLRPAIQEYRVEGTKGCFGTVIQISGRLDFLARSPNRNPNLGQTPLLPGGEDQVLGIIASVCQETGDLPGSGGSPNEPPAPDHVSPGSWRGELPERQPRLLINELMQFKTCVFVISRVFSTRLLVP